MGQVHHHLFIRRPVNHKNTVCFAGTDRKASVDELNTDTPCGELGDTQGQRKRYEQVVSWTRSAG